MILRDEIKVTEADCVVFTEVLEHLHYYHISVILAKINKSLRVGGYLILTTPNIASLFRRLRLLIGRQPIYVYHVREYTMKEVISIIKEARFKVVKAYYSAAYDLNLIDAEPDEYLGITGYKDLLRITIKRPTKLNILRTLAYPLVRLLPTLRQIIVVVSMKTEEPYVKVIERWG